MQPARVWCVRGVWVWVDNRVLVCVGQLSGRYWGHRRERIKISLWGWCSWWGNGKMKKFAAVRVFLGVVHGVMWSGCPWHRRNKGDTTKDSARGRNIGHATDRLSCHAKASWVALCFFVACETCHAVCCVSLRGLLVRNKADVGTSMPIKDQGLQNHIIYAKRAGTQESGERF